MLFRPREEGACRKPVTIACPSVECSVALLSVVMKELAGEIIPGCPPFARQQQDQDAAKREKAGN